MPPGDDVTVYPVITEPPLEVGAVQLTVACAFPAVALTLVGAPGTVIGVTGAEATEAAPIPMPLLATTVKV